MFDRLVAARSGEGYVAAEIVDYKTDADVPGEAPAARVERHREQLEFYRDAAAHLLEIPASAVRTRLLFLQSGECVELLPKGARALR